jgi:hypothetical protein
MYEALRLTAHRAGNRERVQLLMTHGTNHGQQPNAWVTACYALRGSQAGSRICR